MAPKLGFEAAGGVVEKFLPGVSFPVLMNAVLPGALGCLALFPLTSLEVTKLLSLNLEASWLRLAIAAVVVVAIGGLVSSLNYQFYELYEGRTWPRRLFDWGTALQQRQVERLDRKQAAEKGVHEQRYREIWYRLRVYPIADTGKRYASHPTLLGNILYGYEDYPRDRYGMDSVFYWPRLWLVVDKDDREEINKAWAVADGLLSLSAISWIACLAWVGAVLGSLLGLWGTRHLPLHDNFRGTWLASGGWFVLGYGFYRLSLPFHRTNGEVFKSLFDVYRDKLLKLTSLPPNEAERWKAAWAYLQYLRIRCPKCKTGYVSVYESACNNPQCDARSAEVGAALEMLRRTGKLTGETENGSAKKEFQELLRQVVKALDGDG